MIVQKCRRARYHCIEKIKILVYKSNCVQKCLNRYCNRSRARAAIPGSALPGSTDAQDTRVAAAGSGGHAASPCQVPAVQL